jgi:hypothetical protein
MSQHDRVSRIYRGHRIVMRPLFAAAHESGSGPSEMSADANVMAAFEGKADMAQRPQDVAS